MKITCEHTVRLGKVTYPPTSQTEDGFHDLPEGPGLESLFKMGAVQKWVDAKPEKRSDADPEAHKTDHGSGAKP
jgi:hypothetical protein